MDRQEERLHADVAAEPGQTLVSEPDTRPAPLEDPKSRYPRPPF